MTTTIAYTRVRLPETKAPAGQVISWGTEGTKVTNQKGKAASSGTNFSVAGEGHRLGSMAGTAGSMGSKPKRNSGKMSRSRNQDDLPINAQNQRVVTGAAPAPRPGPSSSNQGNTTKQSARSRTADVNQDHRSNSCTTKPPTDNRGVNMNRVNKNRFEKGASGIMFGDVRARPESNGDDEILDLSQNEVPLSPAVAMAARQQRQQHKQPSNQSPNDLKVILSRLKLLRKNKPKDAVSKIGSDTKARDLAKVDVEDNGESKCEENNGISEDLVEKCNESFPEDGPSDSFMLQASQALEAKTKITPGPGPSTKILANNVSIRDTPTFPMTSTPIIGNHAVKLSNIENSTPTSTRAGGSRLRSRPILEESANNSNIFENSVEEELQDRKPPKILKFDAEESPIKPASTSTMEVRLPEVIGDFDDDGEDDLFSQIALPPPTPSDPVPTTNNPDPQNPGSDPVSGGASEKSTLIVSHDSESFGFEDSFDLNESELKNLEDVEAKAKESSSSSSKSSSRTSQSSSGHRKKKMTPSKTPNMNASQLSQIPRAGLSRRSKTPRKRI